jgi:hypothetical protein
MLARWSDADARDARQRVESVTRLLNDQRFVSIESYTEDRPGLEGADFVVSQREMPGHEFPDLLEGMLLLLI